MSLDFQPPALCENHLLPCKPLSLQYSAAAAQANTRKEGSPGKEGPGPPHGYRHSPCSSQCCTRPGTCQSPRSSPGGSRPPGSSGWPGLGARSAAMPGRPCLQRSAGRCAASAIASAPPVGCPRPSALHPVHVPWEGHERPHGASALCLEGSCAPHQLLVWEDTACLSKNRRQGQSTHSFTSKTSRVPRLHFPESLTFPGPHGPEQCSLNIQTGSPFRALELRWRQALARLQNPRKQWVAEAKTSEQKNMQIKIKHWRRVSLSWGQESVYPSRSPSCSRGSSPRLVPPECSSDLPHFTRSMAQHGFKLPLSSSTQLGKITEHPHPRHSFPVKNAISFSSAPSLISSSICTGHHRGQLSESQYI